MLCRSSFQLGLAQIEARAGEPEEAIKRLRRLLSIPAGDVASIARLKIDPVWIRSVTVRISGSCSQARSRSDRTSNTGESCWENRLTSVAFYRIAQITGRSLAGRSQLSKDFARNGSRGPAQFRSTVDSNGRTIWIADAHRDDGKRCLEKERERRKKDARAPLL